MNEPFSSEQAFDADDANEPIMISWQFAKEIIENHGETLDTFTADNPCISAESQLNAATLLSWLGY